MLTCLLACSFAYRDVVMNFVCNLRRLGLYDQLIIAAFDEDMYRFGFRMGLPIFFYQSPDIAGLTSHDLEYGSQHFRKVRPPWSWGWGVIWPCKHARKH